MSLILLNSISGSNYYCNSEIHLSGFLFYIFNLIAHDRNVVETCPNCSPFKCFQQYAFAAEVKTPPFTLQVPLLSTIGQIIVFDNYLIILFVFIIAVNILLKFVKKSQAVTVNLQLL